MTLTEFAGLFAISLLATILIWLAGFLVGWFLATLRGMSRLTPTRPPLKKGVPVEIVEPFERLLAFAVVVLNVAQPAAYGLSDRVDWRKARGKLASASSQGRREG